MNRQLARTSEYHELILSRSYILRLWCAGEPQAGEWHASLEDPFTRERFGFSSLEQMFAFLMERSDLPGSSELLESKEERKERRSQ